MAGHTCYHCKQWVDEGEAHDCWTTTEAALTRDLPEDLQEAWQRLRETAAEFGEQRIYASHHSIMFSRKSCYFFVRPKKNYLELCVFLGRAVTAPQVRRVEPASRSKRVHVIRITHRDEVEAPITDWLREAYELQDALPGDAKARGHGRHAASGRKPATGARGRTAATRKSGGTHNPAAPAGAAKRTTRAGGRRTKGTGR